MAVAALLDHRLSPVSTARATTLLTKSEEAISGHDVDGGAGLISPSSQDGLARRVDLHTGQSLTVCI